MCGGGIQHAGAPAVAYVRLASERAGQRRSQLVAACHSLKQHHFGGLPRNNCRELDEDRLLLASISSICLRDKLIRLRAGQHLG
jgi:hypothetical protein